MSFTEFSELVTASCHDHAVQVETWDEDFIYIGLWSPVGVRKWGRLRRAWWALRGREFFDNDCVMTRAEASEVVRALMDAATACHKLGEMKKAKAR